MGRSFFCVFVFLMSCVSVLQAQDDWIEFVSMKEKGLMSISVDLSLDLVKPKYKNLLIVGGRFKKCLKNGFPSEDSLEEIFAFSDSTLASLDKITPNRLAGYLQATHSRGCWKIRWMNYSSNGALHDFDWMP